MEKDGIEDTGVTSGGNPFGVYIRYEKFIVDNPVCTIELLILTLIFMVPLRKVWSIWRQLSLISVAFPKVMFPFQNPHT